MSFDDPVIHSRKFYQVSHIGLLLCICGGVSAEVTFDGSLGPVGSISGPNYLIDANRGTQVGTNLFHSFGTFNINNGETATFTAEGATGAIDNILARVTGGIRSDINGLLASNISGANLFFLNPSGVEFGPDASLNVQGAFHVSTADYIRLTDGGRFDTSLSSGDALLTMGQPEAFGFLSHKRPAGIHVERSILSNSQNFSITAGGITVTENSALGAKAGSLQLVSVASAGEIKLGNDELDTVTFSDMGNINLGVASLSPDLPGLGLIAGNRVVIRGGQLVLQNTSIQNSNVTDKTANNSTIDIQLTDGLLLQGESAKINVSGDGHKLNIGAGRLELSKGAEISNTNLDIAQRKNSIFINAKDIIVDSVSDSGSGATSRILASGHSDVTLITDTLRTLDGGVVQTQGGDITISAKTVFLDGVKQDTRAGLFASPASRQGDTGDISLTTDQLNIVNGARINTSIRDRLPGSSGNVEIKARQILLDGVGGESEFESSIQAETQGQSTDSGDGGNLSIHTDNLLIRNQANISARTLGPGNGGAIEIDANTIDLQNGGSISSRSDSFSSNAGRSGSIAIDADAHLLLSNNSNITVATQQADAGNIDVSADFLLLKEQSSITTSVANGEGLGGDIDIDAVLLMLNDESEIIANAQAGNAGNIFIKIKDDGALFKSFDSLIEASSRLGIDGAVEINAPDIDITSGLTQLPANLFDAPVILQKPCAQRYQANAIRFVSQKYDVLPDSPYALRTWLPDALVTAKVKQPEIAIKNEKLFSQPSSECL